MPFLRRHPHPMTVHFPIVFMLSAVFFTFLYLITGDPSYDATALHCLAGGVIFTPIVMLTGFISWTVNYLARPMRSVNVKMAVSPLMLLVSLVALVWRETAPDVLTRLSGRRLHLFIAHLFPLPYGFTDWVVRGKTHLPDRKRIRFDRFFRRRNQGGKAIPFGRQIFRERSVPEGKIWKAHSKGAYRHRWLGTDRGACRLPEWNNFRPACRAGSFPRNAQGAGIVLGPGKRAV